MHRRATCSASSGCGAKGDGCDALLALLMEAAAAAASVPMRCYALLPLLTFCRSIFTAASMSQEQPWRAAPALAVLNSTRCCAAI